MQSILVLFGTESGNAQGLAKRAGESLAAAGLTANVVDMAEFDPEELAAQRAVLVITSTYGNGDPPSNAEALHAWLMKKAPRLESLAFSVCALGDTTYERFAQCGKDFDRRLGELGAKRLVDRQDCDVDYDAPFDAWLEKVVPALAAAAKSDAPTSAPARAIPPAPPSAPRNEPPGTRRHPVPATVLANASLFSYATDLGLAARDTRHVVIDTSSLPHGYEAGDSIGIWPANDPALVREILDSTKLSGDARVRVAGTERSLFDALSRHLEIQLVDIRLVERALGPVPSEARHAAVHAHHVVDLVARAQGEWTPESLVDHLRPLAPRLYSVASSPRVHPHDAWLAASIVRYELHGRARSGVASRFLAADAKPGTSLSIYLQPAPHFRLAAKDRDLVMIGPGTGVAPFRAFLEERELDRKNGDATGRAWLFFGARHRASEFLYRGELEGWLASGVLNRLDLAFSRDQAERLHVQHRMREAAAELYAWIRNGAVVYVCGDAKHMAPEVHATLVEILSEQGAMSEDAARAELEAMTADKRYQRDVY
ncbi:MAG: flavodoxin domain-containing protein [Polyangiaceae bacterium]